MLQVRPVHNDLHRIVITGIIWRKEKGENRYLITRRSLEKKVFPGKWTVPGGGLEMSDYIDTPPTHASNQWYRTAEKTLTREIKQEVNLEIDDIQYFLDLTFIRPDGIPVLVLSYYCRYAAGEIKLDAESIEYAWVTLKEVGKYDLIDGIREEIQMVDRLLTNV